MALRATKPEKTANRLKMLLYGESGVGKTMTSIQFPAPYFIETEEGSRYDQYVNALNENGGARFHTTSCSEIAKEVRALLTEKHSYKTLIIDPITIIYDKLLVEAAEKLEKPGRSGTAHGRNYVEANKQIKDLCQLIDRLDMNVIFTAYAKKEYGAGVEPQVIGQTFDCYKKLDYMMDLVIHLEISGKSVYGTVKKSRIETMKRGERFEFNYASLCDRYDVRILEKSSEAQELATKEQIEALIELINKLRIPEETYRKWLDKAKATCWEELDSSTAQKCIDSLTSKIKGE